MKHIFVVSSPITYLATLGVIFLEKLDKNNVLIISDSFNLNNAPIPIVQVKMVESYKSVYKTPSKLFYTHTSIDDIIDNFVGNDMFTAYVHVFVLIDRYLITHPKCIKFNFIEEGFSAYYKYYDGIQHSYYTGNIWRYSNGLKGLKERINDIKRIIRGISPSILAIPTFYTAYAFDKNTIFYGFHEKSHYLAKNRKILSFSDIFKHFNLKAQCEFNNSIIWISDPDIFQRSNNKDEIYSSIKNSFIPYLKHHNISNIYIRFHQRESEEQKKQIINFFNDNNINTMQINQNAIMEVEFLYAQNLTLVGIWSSLLLYGAIMGHKSFSIYEFLPQSIKDVSLVQNEKFELFWSFVKKII